MCARQAEVYIPYGGRKLVKVYAWHEAIADWVDIFTAQDCDVDVTPTDSTDGDFSYVTLHTNPCRTTFPVDTLRLLFNTDLTQQSLMVCETVTVTRSR